MLEPVHHIAANEDFPTTDFRDHLQYNLRDDEFRKLFEAEKQLLEHYYSQSAQGEVD